MIILKLFRPLNGLIGKRFVVNGQLTKSRYFAHDSLLAAAGSSGIEEFLSKHEITINGKDTENLRPIFNFEETGFPDSVIRALKSKFEAPSVIQSVSWPPVLAGRDLVGIARTGSGKTLSFLLPALVHISKREPVRHRDGPVVLILCPTRELAQQVQAVANEWGDMLTRVRTLCVFGGANRAPQEMKLASGVDIVVATPGRLNDFLNARVTNMRRCTYLVLDEADRMLDMGFEPQIREIIDRIDKDRQTLMYSATWPNEVRQLAGDFMKEFVHVKIGSAELSANKNITQVVHVTTQLEKDRRFWQLLQELLERDPDGKILVFCLQKSLTNRLEYKASSKGMAASCIHGDKSQAMRDRTLSSFRSGKTQILFGTDVAARGLDVDDIKYVVNYDHPFCAEDYVHRIGRTARRDLEGESHTFLTEDDAGERARDLIKVLEASDQPVSEELKQLAMAQTTSAKGNIRRWGGGGGFQSLSSYGSARGHFDRNRRSSFSDRHYDRGARNRYERYSDYNDNNDIIDRSRNRYSNFNDQRQKSRSRDYDDIDDYDVLPRRGGSRK